jgi:hypothetical protein
VADLVGWAAASLIRVEKITHLSPREQAIEAVRLVKQPRALPASRVDEILTLTRVWRANLGALTSYDPSAYDGHLTYVRTAAADRALPVDRAVEYWTSRALGGATVHPASAEWEPFSLIGPAVIRPGRKEAGQGRAIREAVRRNRQAASTGRACAGKRCRDRSGHSAF